MGSLNGKIRPTLYGSLKKGKYDADNTFALVSFDSSVGDSGGWKLLTPVQDVSG
jgi:hypothetical protein